ncbi:MAG TPA: hypothetical protein VLM05_06350, partial [Mycobacteriales bacterium]|nr:hypothetical protein [Mycobacteriales bacterium]
LQVPPDEATEALDVVERLSVDGEPVLRAAGAGVWTASRAVVGLATRDRTAWERAKRRGLLTWRRPDASGADRLVRAYLAATGSISSSNVAGITGLTPQGALNLLNRLEGEGTITRGTAARGRGAHFVAAPET